MMASGLQECEGSRVYVAVLLGLAGSRLELCRGLGKLPAKARAGAEVGVPGERGCEGARLNRQAANDDS